MSFLSSKKFMLIASFLGLYLLSTGASLAIFSYLKTDSSLFDPIGGLEGERSRIAEMEKTEVCPINGAKFTKVEASIWKSRRPLAIIVENHIDARPQSGLSKADVVYEVVAEGGITRLLAIYYCGAAAEDVRVSGVRSVRVYYVDMASEYGISPIFLHWGGANNYCPDCPGGAKSKSKIDPRADAYSLLDSIGWRMGQSGNDMDGGMNVGAPVVIRDRYRLSDTPAAWEHSTVAFTDEAYIEAEERGFAAKDADGDKWDKTFVSWNFADGSPLSSPKTSSISFNFWRGKGDYDVKWEYDNTTNSYLRFNGGKVHIDWEYDKPQLSAKNVVIQFVEEEGPVDNELHMLYELVGDGEALIFLNGNVIKGTWEKDSRTSRTKFFDKDSKEVKFVRGQIWIEIVPDGNKIDY